MDLIDALIYKNYPQVKNLLLQGIDPNFYEDRARVTPLHFAITYKAPAEVILLLLTAGADPTASTDEGITPLDYARNNHRHDLIKLFTYFISHKGNMLPYMLAAPTQAPRQTFNEQFCEKPLWH